MADFQQTFNSNGSVQIPSYAINVRVDIAGSRGGGGGNDAGANAGQGGGGRRATISFPNYTARTLNFYIGRQGGTGRTGSNAGGGSAGSSNAARGGIGGNSANNGYSGAGGGGGGASGIYDSLKNGWVVIVGGGGGGGGASLNRSGGTGGAGRGLSGNPNNRSVGSNGQKNTSQPSGRPDGGGGGGGGGGCGGGSGGSFGIDNNRGGGGGQGGRSGYDSSYCSLNNNTINYGNGFAIVYYDISNPTIDSFSLSPTAFIRGQCTTLSWSSTNATSASINQGIGAVSVDGSTVSCPTNTTTYTLIVSRSGRSTTSTVTATVYIPPIVTLSLNNSTIVLGQSAILSWNTTGDASTNNIQPGIGSSNLVSQVTVSPTVTTTYTATVSGLGGTDTDQITLTVLQPPEVDLIVPLNVSYGNSLELGYTSINATTSLKIVPYYYSLDGVETIGADVVLPTGDNVSGTITHTPVWDNRGPARIEYKLLAEGAGSLTDEDVKIVPAIIDQLPDSITVPESDDTFKNEEPIVTPNIELTTEELLVTDIDIPVEIKSDYPIQVEIDNNGVWIDVENI